MQVQASNHPKRLWSKKPTVVSVGEKAHVMRQVWTKKVSDKRTSGGVEKFTDDVKTGVQVLLQD